MKNVHLKNLTLSAMFLGLGFVLPFLTGQIPQIGSMLLPMHIPVFLCAFICSWKYGVAVAFILPLLRSVIFGVPNMYPEAISIALEMATYAFVAGFLYGISKHKCIFALYRSMLIAMVAGRVVRCIVQLSLMGIKGVPFSFEVFFTSVILRGVPGMILQLTLIPGVMLLLHKTKLVPMKNKAITDGKEI